MSETEKPLNSGTETKPLRRPAEPAGGLSSVTKAWIAIGIAVAVVVVLIVWQYRHPQTDFITHITKDDMNTLLEDAPPQQLQQWSTNEKSRKDLLKQVKELLAEAVEAKNTGMANSPEVKEQLAFMRSLAVAQAYDAKQRKGNPAPAFATIKPEEVDAFLKGPGMEDRFTNFIKVAQAGKILPEGDIPEEQKTQLKQDWAKILLTEKKADQEGFSKERKTKLQITLQQAQLLAQKYSKDVLADKVKASDAEIATYIAAHPEYDIAPKRAKAEDLLKRARGGEDFATLAKANTEDPGSKENGGFYDWYSRGKMVKEFDDAAFSLQVGQISDIVETQFGFHIIKLEGKRTQKNKDTGKDEDQVQVRHILISTMAPPDPENPMSPQVPLKDKAKADIEKDKREKLIADIVKRSGVTVPDDFEVKVPPMPPPGQQGPGGDDGGPPGGPPGGPDGGPQGPDEPQQAPQTGGNGQKPAAPAQKGKPTTPAPGGKPKPAH